MEEELKACRYRVEKTGYGFWPYCVRAGDGTRELFKGHQKQCMVVAAELETAFEDGKFVAERAILTSQEGEAVEVVAYLGDGGTLYPNKRSADKYLPVGRCAEPLMTVAQHQRILAALTAPPLIDPALTNSQCACGDEYAANSYGAGFMAANNGVCENCDTYTAPPAPDAELVELLREAHAHVYARAVYSFGAGNVLGRIEAKLESLEVKP
jgi:hypothetical protein